MPIHAWGSLTISAMSTRSFDSLFFVFPLVLVSFWVANTRSKSKLHFLCSICILLKWKFAYRFSFNIHINWWNCWCKTVYLRKLFPVHLSSLFYLVWSRDVSHITTLSHQLKWGSPMVAHSFWMVKTVYWGTYDFFILIKGTYD